MTIYTQAEIEKLDDWTLEVTRAKYRNAARELEHGDEDDEVMIETLRDTADYITDEIKGRIRAAFKS